MDGTRPRRTARHWRGDDGISLVLVALMMFALVMVAALAIDGGQAYATRRQMQNASDSAAMAATAKLQQLRAGTATAQQVVDAATAAVTANKGSSTSQTVTCQLIDTAYNKVSGTVDDVCAPGALAAEWSKPTVRASAVGLSVSARGEAPQFFAQVGNVAPFRPSASAAAAIFNFGGGTGAPFIVCGWQPSDGYPILQSTAPPVISDAAAVSLDAQGKPPTGAVPYFLQGPDPGGKGVPGCGLGASFDGKLDPDFQNVVLGQPTIVQQGNGKAQIPPASDALQNTNPAKYPLCRGAAPFGLTANGTGCFMLLPIAASSNGGNGNNKMEMTPVAWGVFYVQAVQAQGKGIKYQGWLVAQPDRYGFSVSGTIASGGSDPNQPSLIKLVK